MSLKLIDLPIDIVVQIVDSLKSFDARWSASVAMRQVCTHMRSASIAWAHAVDEADLKTSVVPTCVAARVLPSLRRVSCGGYWSTVTDASLESLALHCSRLTHVDVSRCPAISSEGVATLARACAELTYLDLTECYDVECVVEVARACPKLEHVDLTWCYMVQDDSVEALALHCPRLTYISMHACHRVSDASVLARCRSLAHVDVSGCMLAQTATQSVGRRDRRRDDDTEDDTKDDVGKSEGGRTNIAALRECTNLSYLNVSGCGPTVDDAALTTIVRRCVRLVHVRLAHCITVTDASIRALARSCTSLTHIDVSSVSDLTDASFVELGTHCPHLRHVRAAHCALLGDGGVCALARGCSNLSHLDMWQCTRVTDVGVEMVARECSNLRYVCFRGSAVTEVGVLALVTGRSSSKLRHVDVHGAAVSSSALAAVRDSCPHLWHLDVALVFDSNVASPQLRHYFGPIRTARM
jgi:F-box/leucine-rich repeat protein 2/20